MTLDDLKAQARAILEIQPTEGFKHHSFYCRSGGAPSNKVGVPEVHRESRFEYDTVANGCAYSGTVVVDCRETGTRDADGRDIYLTPEGTVFVFRYQRGSPDSFDYGALVAPRMK